MIHAAPFAPTAATINGEVSFWYADIGGLPPRRAPLTGDVVADVCIVGGGYTGLWVAYYLKRASPGLRIVILEKAFAGYGASGRNGGWLSGKFSWSQDRYLSTGTREGVVEMQQAMIDTVDEVIAVAETNGIDADILRTDILHVATTPAQLARLEAFCSGQAKWSLPAHRRILVDREAVRARVQVKDAIGAIVTQGVARVQPAKLVRGLAALVERMGVEIFEDSEVLHIDRGCAVTPRGSVRAPVIVRATEGYTAGLPGQRRNWLPLNSTLMVTAPLSAAQWTEIGWANGELLSHELHTYAYLQRTREGRIAMGGRGVPYRFGSRTDIDGQTQDQTIRQLHHSLINLFPTLKDLRIDHAWCGVLGVPRDWCASVGFDPRAGVAWAGGYVGNGVSTSNLAGRTLTDLILGRDTELVRLPWVNRTVRQWEPEPLRWLGVQAMYKLYGLADIQEADGRSQTSPLARLADRLTGH